MRISRKQSGASLAEFIIAAPIVMIVGMTTVQAGLIYHGKTTLNYAAFEAARAGAVNNAQLTVMRDALGLRLAPVQGGDGSTPSAMIALAKSVISAKDGSNTRVKVLNPTTAAFDDWGVNSQTSNRRVIPNNHLRHKEHDVGSSSGLSLRDANLLKIEVTYGIDMKIPVVGGIIARSMALIDPANAHYYARRKFPVSSVATVRMQSEAWEEEIVIASAEYAASEQPPPGSSNDFQHSGENGEGESGSGGADQQAGDEGRECDQGIAGLPNDTELLQSSAYDEAECPATAPEYGGAGENDGGTSDGNQC